MNSISLATPQCMLLILTGSDLRPSQLIILTSEKMKVLVFIYTCFVLILDNANFDHFRYKDKTDKNSQSCRPCWIYSRGNLLDGGESLS